MQLFLLLTLLLLLQTGSQLIQNQSDPLKSLHQDKYQHVHQHQNIPSDQRPMHHLTKKRSLHPFLSLENPIWLVSVKIFKFLFTRIVTLVYYPHFFLFNFLNHLTLWLWDLLISPITFPIRLACWILIIKPILISKNIFIQLQPVIAFLISGLTTGVFIGILGSVTHIFLADRLFPLNLKTLKNQKLAPQQTIQVLDSKKKTPNSIGNQNERVTSTNKTNYYPDLDNQNSTPIKNQGLKTKYQERANQKGRRRKEFIESQSSTSLSSEEELISANEEVEELESHLKDSIEPNQFGYSSAIQPMANDRTSRKRSSSHHQIDTPPPSILSSHNSPRHLLSPFSSSHGQQGTFPSPSNKKKVTFKTD